MSSKIIWFSSLQADILLRDKLACKKKKKKKYNAFNHSSLNLCSCCFVYSTELTSYEENWKRYACKLSIGMKKKTVQLKKIKLFLNKC